jgi:hypothetical protein
MYTSVCICSLAEAIGVLCRSLTAACIYKDLFVALGLGTPHFTYPSRYGGREVKCIFKIARIHSCLISMTVYVKDAYNKG